MKITIIMFSIAIVLSCLLNSVIFPVPAFNTAIGFSNVLESQSFGVKREESMISEINYIDGSRPESYITTISGGKESRSMADFPLGANN